MSRLFLSTGLAMEESRGKNPFHLFGSAVYKNKLSKALSRIIDPAIFVVSVGGPRPADFNGSIFSVSVFKHSRLVK
jgi:hypothetical protein